MNKNCYQQVAQILSGLLRPKPQIFLGSHGRWYVRYGESTHEDYCPSFHTEEMARKWAAWEEE